MLSDSPEKQPLKSDWLYTCHAANLYLFLFTAAHTLASFMSKRSLGCTIGLAAIEASYISASSLLSFARKSDSVLTFFKKSLQLIKQVMILQLLVSVGLFYLSWSLLAMELKYRGASSMGITLVRLTVDALNLFWLVFEAPIWRLFDLLPLDFGNFGRYSRRGWHFLDKADSHLKYGPIWGIVTPRDIYIYIADPEAIRDVFNRRTDFLRPSKMYSKLARSRSLYPI